MSDEKKKTKPGTKKKLLTKSKIDGNKKQASKKSAAKKEAPKKSYEVAIEKAEFAARQRHALVMFVVAFVLIAIITIPGELVWLWAHNFVRGTFSMFALFWPILLLFLAGVTMLNRKINKLKSRTALACGLVVALNACVFIFTYDKQLTFKQVYENAWSYKGGGIVGYIFGMPFVKLFGQTPAKILIILIIVVLVMLLTNVTVKNIYNVVYKCTSKVSDNRRAKAEKQFENRKYQSVAKKVQPSVVFDDDEVDFEELPQSPVLSNTDIFADDGDEEVHIDIDIDSPMDAEETQNDGGEDEDENILYEIFGADFMDTMDPASQEEQPKASKIAERISLSKKTPRKSDPSQKQYDPQTVPVDISDNRRRREKDNYCYPPVELLNEPVGGGSANADAELKENARKLIETLESFSVGAKIVGYCRGPSITRYEIQPAPGVKISKITGLSDDIALNLAAEGVRIEAPIPGKPAIGIEIPNKTVTQVSIRELIDTDEFRYNKSKLACVLGRDVAGKIVITDLAKMPHLLIAGTTGSGKSVCVNSILMSLIYRASSEDVKLILIDPKLVEFSKYKGIPHLLIPVVSDSKKAAAALNWAVTEMEQRYKEFSIYNVRDIDSYNKMVKRNLETMTDEEFEEESNGEVVDGEFIPPKAKKKMPKIVIAIDELADLMMVAPGEVEESICRLAQKARAAGMHLVIATQRPSVNVITGVIKANIPSRISLKVASYVDSKTILDAGGGEKLIGRGDMLYSPVGVAKPIRVQGCYSSDEEIEAVTDFIKNHSGADYDEKISDEIERISVEELTKGKDSSSGDAEPDDSDPMLDEAVKLVVEAGQASTSLLQRRLRLGYARAGRLIDTMEQMGIVGPHEGSKSRKVLLTYDQWLERQVTGSND